MLLIAAATTAATAQTYTDLHNFHEHDGAYPQGILAQGRDGNLYGTAVEGGAYKGGTAFRITPSGTVSVLHSFDFDFDDEFPYGGLTLGTDGNLYGTTAGEDGDRGMIFKITPRRSLTTLYYFTGGTDGGHPYAAPIQGTDGDFYGTTTSPSTAYKITSSGIFTALASLPGSSYAPLLQGTNGNFYGTTNVGGSYDGGTVFKMTPKGVVTVLYNFDGTNERGPFGPVIQGNDGNLYGTSEGGGSNAVGFAFKLTAQGAITVLHNFGDPEYPNDGAAPRAGLVQATDGNFYGVTTIGGTAGNGVIFQITPGSAYSVLYSFSGAPQGGLPYSTAMQHTNGKIYGLTWRGGTADKGVVYSFDMGLAPFVSLVSTTRKIGKTVEILGQGFTGTTAVSFNGAAATFTVVSDTYLTATVPAGATTGFVTITTPSGTLTSNKPFRVKP